MSQENIEELPASDLEEELGEVSQERVSLLSAAANARNVAMLTGTHGVIAAPLDRAVVHLPSPSALLPAGAAPLDEADAEAGLRGLLAARARAADAEEDAVAKARVHLEVAYARLDAGDREGAIAEARRASEATEHAPAAYALVRVLVAKRDDANEQLAQTTRLAAHANEKTRPDFLAEKGRILVARDGASAEAASAFQEALALAPEHAAALYGLEVTLDAAARWPELAAHFASLAGLAGDPELAAWLHVERALLLDRRVGDAAGARAALDQALALAPGQGPVRDAAIDHAVLHRDAARLAALLEAEAGLEKDAARATRLELDAALAWLEVGSEPARARKLLEKAHGRAPTSKLTHRRVAEELAQLLEKAERFDELLRVRKAALRLASEPREELVALRAVAWAAERAGAIDDAVLALERARVVDVDDPTLLDELDRLLLGAQRHEARAVTWMREAARVEEAPMKARALLTAAQAARAAGRDADAAKYLQSAWISAPAAAGTFDALAERLAPASARSAVEPRVALYEQAARATSDAHRKLYYLEKIAWLWDDVAGDPAAAARAYEEVLALDGARSSAIAGLVSAATRAGDSRRLARALLAEADGERDAERAAEARLRAAEALAYVDAERALALAEELRKVRAVATRAAEVVTRLHATAGRWELVAKTLEERRHASDSRSLQTALALAEVDVLAARLGAPDRALATLADARKASPDDPALAKATLSALEALGDIAKLRAELESLAEAATTPETRALFLVRAAELSEPNAKGDTKTLALYLRARDALPVDPLAPDRLRRLGARVEVPADLVPPLVAAVRALDRDVPLPPAEPLLASEMRAFCKLRVAERLARRADAAPQLANALAMQVDLSKGTLALRALWGLATLVTWTLPNETSELEPWDRLLAHGSEDAIALDNAIVRARATDESLALALDATRRRLALAADATERLVLRLDEARFARRLGKTAEAITACRDALAIEPASVTAAVLLGELAGQSSDRRSAIEAATALAAVTVEPRARASLLRDAADLASAAGDAPSAASLLERSLDADPDAVAVAARLAALQLGRRAFADLARVLRRGLAAATTPEAIVPMASELADVARNKLSDPLLAIEALERARAVSPGHVPALLNLAELYIGQRAWQKSLAALADVIERSHEKSEKLTAHSGRASIFARVLDQPKDAETELRAALVLDPHDARAAGALLKLPGVVSSAERAELLGRLALAEPAPAERLSALLELADVRRGLGDVAGAEGALVEAAALSPDPAMLQRVRAAIGDEPVTVARVLGRALARARESSRAPATAWLVSLGEIELGLGRVEEAIERFEEVLRAEPSHAGVRVSFARALAKAGRHEAAAAALAPLLERGAFPENGKGLPDTSFVRLLDESLSGAGRLQQAHVARELRAIAGDLDEQGSASLLARRRSWSGDAEPLGVASLRSFVMPNGVGKHAFWDAAAIASGLGGKLARVALTDHGSSTKERVKPKTQTPLRQLFDRVARAFDVGEVELAASDHAVAPSLAVEDVPLIVAPSSLADWPESHALAALARLFVRVALGVPWVGAMGADEVLAAVTGVARLVAPGFPTRPEDRAEALVGDYELRAKKAIDRKRRRALEDLEPMLEHTTKALDVATFSDAVARTEARAAFLLSGDLRAVLDALATNDAALTEAIRVPGPAALGGVLGASVPRDLVAFAMSGDATALRHSLGTLWA